MRDNFLLVTDSYQKELYQFGTFSNEVYAIPTGKHYRPIAIDYDPVREKIFWTDTNAKVIKTSGLKGEGVAVVKAFTSGDCKKLSNNMLILCNFCYLIVVQ